MAGPAQQKAGPQKKVKTPIVKKKAKSEGSDKGKPANKASKASKAAKPEKKEAKGKDRGMSKGKWKQKGDKAKGKGKGMSKGKGKGKGDKANGKGRGKGNGKGSSHQHEAKGTGKGAGPNTVKQEQHQGQRAKRAGSSTLSRRLRRAQEHIDAAELQEPAESGQSRKPPQPPKPLELPKEVIPLAQEEIKEPSAAAARRAKPKTEGEPRRKRGLVYVGHIPKGFDEEEMKEYFSQFGKVTRLRHSRAKKSGASRGYGWVEFADEAVAKIAQETMNGYLLFGKKLVCSMVYKDKKRHHQLMALSGRPVIDRTAFLREMAKKIHNTRPTISVDGELVPRQTVGQKRRRGRSSNKLRMKLKKLGVDYDVSAVLGEGKKRKERTGKPSVGASKKNEEAPEAGETVKQAKKT